MKLKYFSIAFFSPSNFLRTKNDIQYIYFIFSIHNMLQQCYFVEALKAFAVFSHIIDFQNKVSVNKRH